MSSGRLVKEAKKHTPQSCSAAFRRVALCIAHRQEVEERSAGHRLPSGRLVSLLFLVFGNKRAFSTHAPVFKAFRQEADAACKKKTM